MRKAVFLVLLGLVILAGVVLLFFRTWNKGPIAVAAFGLATAVLVPTSLWLFSSALESKSRQALVQLTKVAEIQQLLDKAKSQEERVHILENRYGQLEEIIAAESSRIALQSHKEGILKQARDLLTEYDAISDVLASANAGSVDETAAQTVQRLRQYVEAARGDNVVLKIGRTHVALNRELLALPLLLTPFFGFGMYVMFRELLRSGSWVVRRMP
jgi:hypothetical protein